MTENSQNIGCTRTGIPNSEKFRSYAVRGGSPSSTVRSFRGINGVLWGVYSDRSSTRKY